jgi:hypothetical protein
MLMRMSGKWMEMLHGEANLAEQQQTGPRGRDKLYSVNWAMAMVQRPTAHGQWTFVSMLSLEPATITGRYYPELFQQGETAFGKAIVDGQHPHDLFMELAAIYDAKLGERKLASIYAAPVGDPALGPVAFPHRMSAESDPLAPLAHHLQDSTHIAYDVVTGGVTWDPHASRLRDFTAGNQARIAGRSMPEPWTPGRRGLPSRRSGIGLRSTQSGICARRRRCIRLKMCFDRRHQSAFTMRGRMLSWMRQPCGEGITPSVRM